jgi:hypothetical protein
LEEQFLNQIARDYVSILALLRQSGFAYYCEVFISNNYEATIGCQEKGIQIFGRIQD